MANKEHMVSVYRGYTRIDDKIVYWLKYGQLFYPFTAPTFHTANLECLENENLALALIVNSEAFKGFSEKELRLEHKKFPRFTGVVYSFLDIRVKLERGEF